MFTAQGAALNKAASRNVKVLVVGNSANTTAYIALKSAPDLPAETFTAMLRLDHSRIPEGIIYGVPVSPKTGATPASPAWKWMIVPGQRWANARELSPPFITTRECRSGAPASPARGAGTGTTAR